MRDKRGRWVLQPHHVCFDCRVSFKDIAVCPHCHQPLTVTRVKFKPPRRSNLREWKRLYLLYLAKQDWNAVATPREARQILEQCWTDNVIDQWRR